MLPPPGAGVGGLDPPPSAEAGVRAPQACLYGEDTCLTTEKLREKGVIAGREDSIRMSLAIDKVVTKLLYDPRYKGHPTWFEASWASAIFAWRGRATLGWMYFAMIIWSIGVVGLLKEYFGVVPGVKEEPWVNMKPIPLILISVGLMFLVVFRTQTSYQKWTTARQSWVQINMACRELAIQSTVYMNDFEASSALCRYMVVFILTVRRWLRSEEMGGHLVGSLITEEGLNYLMAHPESTKLQQQIDDDNGLSYQFKKVCAPLAVLEVMRSILDACVAEKRMLPFHSMMEGNFKILSMALATMERVLDTQLPFAYITHVRTAILVYSLSIPVFLTIEIGWFTVFFVAFYCYVVMGLENLAVEIENPFGSDENDLPMDSYCCRITRDICHILRRRQEIMLEVAGAATGQDGPAIGASTT